MGGKMGEPTKTTNMAHQFNGFKATKPAVCIKDSGKSYYEVFFTIYSAGQETTWRSSKGINNVRVSERKAQASAMADVLWEALRDGWNPLTTKYPFFPKEANQPEVMTFSAALDYGLNVKIPHLSVYSVSDYRGAVRFMKKAAEQCGFATTKITSILRRDIRVIVNTAREQNNWSANARNKYLNLLKSILTVLVDEELLPFNPAHNIKEEYSVPGPGYKRLTDAEKQKIYVHLTEKAPAYFEYLMLLYDDGVRRTETLLLKIKDVNFSKREILIRPEVAKTNVARKVPITDDILQLLLRREIWTLNPEWYIFSKRNFAPGPQPFHPNTPTAWWNRLVIKELGIDCKMYSLKHKGADDKIIAGINPEALKKMYGHKSMQMTEYYAEEIKEKYKQEIIAGAPSFAKVVTMNKKAM